MSKERRIVTRVIFFAISLLILTFFIAPKYFPYVKPILISMTVNTIAIITIPIVIIALIIILYRKRAHKIEKIKY